MAKPDHGIVRSRVSAILSKNGAIGTSAVQIRRVLGGSVEKKDINKVLYDLKKQGLCSVDEDARPPLWRILGTNMTSSCIQKLATSSGDAYSVSSSLSINPQSRMSGFKSEVSPPPQGRGRGWALRTFSSPPASAHATSSDFKPVTLPRKGRGKLLQEMRASVAPYNRTDSPQHQRRMSQEQESSPSHEHPAAITSDSFKPKPQPASVIPPSPASLLRRRSVQPITERDSPVQMSFESQSSEACDSPTTVMPQQLPAPTASERALVEQLEAMNKHAVSALSEWAQANRVDFEINCLRQSGPSHQPT